MEGSLIKSNEVKLSEKFSKRSGQSRRQKFMIVGLIIALIFAIIISVSLLIFSQNAIETNHSANLLPDIIEQVSEFTETSTLVSASTVISMHNDSWKIVTRQQWGAFRRKCMFHLRMPVARIIIRDTKTETCNSQETCARYLKAKQIETYPTLSDIEDNFLIDPQGVVYECRGFMCEGQHTYDKGSASYNNHTISVSFIGNYSAEELNDEQKNALKLLIKSSIEDDNLRRDYILYYQEQLTNRITVPNLLYEEVKKMKHWKASKLKFFCNLTNKHDCSFSKLQR